MIKDTKAATDQGSISQSHIFSLLYQDVTWEFFSDPMLGIVNLYNSWQVHHLYPVSTDLTELYLMTPEFPNVYPSCHLAKSNHGFIDSYAYLYIWTLGLCSGA